MSGLAEELKRRSEEKKPEASEHFILIQGLQNYKKLRQEDEFGFSAAMSGRRSIRPPRF